MVCRNNFWKPEYCSKLVPGDLIQIKCGECPCDILILKGRLNVDEYFLNGENFVN